MKFIKAFLSVLLFASTVNSFGQKYVGGDISLLTKYETNGATYYDHDGTAISSPLTFFKDQGWNAMRVRLFVDPSKASSTAKGQGVCQDLEYVKVFLGKRIKDARIQLCSISIIPIHGQTQATNGHQPLGQVSRMKTCTPRCMTTPKMFLLNLSQLAQHQTSFRQAMKSVMECCGSINGVCIIIKEMLHRQYKQLGLLHQPT